jgi:hypothetical protein
MIILQDPDKARTISFRFFLTTIPSTDKMTSTSGQLLSSSLLLFIFLYTFYHIDGFHAYFTSQMVILSRNNLSINHHYVPSPKHRSIQADGLGRGSWAFLYMSFY